MISIEAVLLGTSVLLFLSVIASKTSGRLGVPALLVFLVLGMLAGSEGPGGIYFDNARLAQSLGVTALALILFAGGLDTHWKSVRPLFWQGFSLSTLGVCVTALGVGWFASAALGFSFLEGLLLGAIVSSTDAAAVFSVLRNKNVGLKGNLRPLLELESGSNDPMAVFLVIGLVRLLAEPETSAADLVFAFTLQMGLGALIGYALGKGILFLVNRLRLEYEGLYPVLTLSLVLFCYSFAAQFHGNGFLAVYAAGLVMGQSNFTHKKSLIRFHDGLAWLMQIAMFLALGLLVYPSRLVPIAGSAVLVSLFLMFLARPASVFTSLLAAGIPMREKLFISWVGLRGAAPIVLATFPLLAGLPRAEALFNLVFFIVLTSVLLQGTSISFVARLLKVDSPLKSAGRYPLEFEQPEGVDTELVDFIVPYGSNAAGRTIVEINLPKDSLITLICRDEKFMVPAGATVIEEGDVLLVLANEANQKEVQALLSKPKRIPGIPGTLT